jgi:predicted Zn finger-like uncharacterized protein
VYTQCPECHTAFRVTVEVLQKAGGRVRCGGCEHAFSALDYLSDGVPGTAPNQSASASAASEATNDSPAEEFDEKSRALLETLDELAGPQDVRIEDTGIEWRVLEKDDDVEVDTGSQESLDLNADSSNDEHSSPAVERRYDDNTELPDDFADEEESPYVAETPLRRETDVDEQQTDFDTQQVDMALEGDETWARLFDDDDKDEVEVEVEAGDATVEDDATDSIDDLARQIEKAEARQIADDSALLPQLAESLIQEAQSSDGKIEYDGVCSVWRGLYG